MRKAFTLIELLVVIVIIGLLMAMIVPKVGAALRSARESTCRTNLRNLQTAVISHTIDNDRHMPFAGSHEWFYKGKWHESRGWVSWIPEDIVEPVTWPTWPSESSNTPDMMEAGYTGELALRGIRNGTLYKYLDKELGVYRCPVAANDKLFREHIKAAATDKVHLTYVMNEFFHHQAYPSSRSRVLSWLGTQEDIKVRDVGGSAIETIVPEASRLPLFSEHSGVEWSSVETVIGRNCVSHIPDESQEKEVTDITDTSFPRLGGHHDGPIKLRDTNGKLIPWGLVVYVDGHIEKVFPNVCEALAGKDYKDKMDPNYKGVKNIAWLLNRGLDSPNKLPAK